MYFRSEEMRLLDLSSESDEDHMDFLELAAVCLLESDEESDMEDSEEESVNFEKILDRAQGKLVIDSNKKEHSLNRQACVVWAHPVNRLTSNEDKCPKRVNKQKLCEQNTYTAGDPSVSSQNFNNVQLQEDGKPCVVSTCVVSTQPKDCLPIPDSSVKSLAKNRSNQKLCQQNTHAVEDPSVSSPNFNNVQLQEDSQPDHPACVLRTQPEDGPSIPDASGKSLTKHVRKRKLCEQNTYVYTGGDPFMCDVCEAKFVTQEQLKTHFLSHTDGKLFVCDVCDKGFTTSKLLISHSHVHFTCDVCNRIFTTLGQLRAHCLTHAQDQNILLNPLDGPFTCTICGEDFTQESTLTTHMNVHLKPHACDLCNRRFEVEDQLREHSVEFHTGDVGRPHVCKECGKRFTQLKHLRAHHHNKHAKSHVCDVCGLAFSANSYLRMHMFQHTWAKT